MTETMTDFMFPTTSAEHCSVQNPVEKIQAFEEVTIKAEVKNESCRLITEETTSCQKLMIKTEVIDESYGSNNSDITVMKTEIKEESFGLHPTNERQLSDDRTNTSECYPLRDHQIEKGSVSGFGELWDGNTNKSERNLFPEDGIRNDYLEEGNVAEGLLNDVCRICRIKFEDYCTHCGYLVHILSNEVKVGVEGRAKHTIPRGFLELKQSSGQEYGVVALKTIPKNVQFGPYEGLETAVQIKNGFVWKIRCGKLVNTDDESCSNWMKYVACTTIKSLQNLRILQFLGKVYYKSLREIKIGEELLIWYGANCSDNMEYFQPEIEVVIQNSFKCFPCCFGFSKEEYLVNHNKNCPYMKREEFEENCKTEVFICEFCKVQLLNFKYYKSHIKICGRNNKLRLNHREDVVANDNEKEIDETTKGDLLFGQRRFKCPHCDCDYSTKKSLKKHIKAKHLHSKDYSKLKCTECDYIAKRTYDLERHMEAGTHWNKIICKICNKTLKSQKYFIQHIKTHNEARERKVCPYCDHNYFSQASLGSHMRQKHLNEEILRCIHCPYTTDAKGSLKTHVLLKHSNTEKLHKCDFCDYSTHLRSHLKVHVRTHTNEKPYQCHYHDCNYRGARPRDLKNHVMCHHTKEKPYKCNDCPYAATQKAGLVSHIQGCHQNCM